MFTNLVTNLTTAWQAFLDFLTTGKFKFDWKPLLDGFVATAAQLPELIKPELTSLQSEIDTVAGRIADREGARAAAAVSKAKATKAVADQAATLAGKKDKEFKSEASGLSEFAGKLRDSIFSAKDNDAKKQLAATERTAKAAEETAAALKKGIPAVMG